MAHNLRPDLASQMFSAHLPRHAWNLSTDSFSGGGVAETHRFVAAAAHLRIQA